MLTDLNEKELDEYRSDVVDPVGPGGPTFPGLMTNGIDDPAGHYYRRVFTDAVRAVDALKTSPAVDPDRIAVAGGSQGGAMALRWRRCATTSPPW